MKMYYFENNKLSDISHSSYISIYKNDYDNYYCYFEKRVTEVFP